MADKDLSSMFDCEQHDDIEDYEIDDETEVNVDELNKKFNVYFSEEIILNVDTEFDKEDLNLVKDDQCLLAEEEEIPQITFVDENKIKRVALMNETGGEDEMGNVEKKQKDTDNQVKYCKYCGKKYKRKSYLEKHESSCKLESSENLIESSSEIQSIEKPQHSKQKQKQQKVTKKKKANKQGR